MYEGHNKRMKQEKETNLVTHEEGLEIRTQDRQRQTLKLATVIGCTQ